MTRPTEAVISLDNIINNYNLVKNIIGDKAEIFPVIKANAYGHGSKYVAGCLKRCGARTFCVAMVEEALELIDSGIDANYIILGGIFEKDAEKAVRMDLAPCVFSPEHAQSLDREASRQKKKIGIHIKVDTGMGRIGVDPIDMFKLLESVYNMKNISVEGILSHLSVPESEEEDDRRYTKDQLGSFELLKKGIENKGYNIPFFHIAGSAALLEWRESHHDAVRPGILIYGSSPSTGFKIPEGFKPAMTLRSKISFIKKVPRGTSISYGRKTIVKRDSIIATVPIGYADGLSRAIQPGFEFLVKGKKAPLTGVVTMDMIMLDVTDIKDVSTGDEVILIGSSGEETIRPEQIAHAAGTIPYEVFTSISSRVPRIYSGNKKE
jgi:alanine racemase